MKMLSGLVCLLLAGCGSSPSPANGLRPAGDMQSPQALSGSHGCGAGLAGLLNYTYCIDRPASNIDDSNVVVFLHGIYGSAETWSSMPSLTQGLAAVRGGHMPTVISLSLGQVWLLSDNAAPATESVYSAFVHLALPQVEAKLAAPVLHRVLIGESMGGFNALQILARDSSKFERIALVCPAIAPLNPFSSDADVSAYLQTHPEVSPDFFRFEQHLAQATFKTEAGYAPHDPNTIAGSLSAAAPPIFISAGEKDQLGFFEGSSNFAAAAAARGAHVTWFPIANGKHCEQTNESLAALGNFLK